MFVENKEKIYCQFDERLRASYTNSTQVNTPMSEHVVFYSFSNVTEVKPPMSEHVVFYSFSNLTEVNPPMSEHVVFYFFGKVNHVGACVSHSLLPPCCWLLNFFF